MMIMEIRHLQTFAAIAELGGFTKAADRLGYAQSTVTSHIQLLENELAAPLFDRLGKKIVLTAAGRELVPYAREMLRLYSEIKNIPSAQGEVSGKLVIGAGESLSIYRLGEILKEFKRSYPKVNIFLKNSTCSDLRSMLHSGDLDIIFTIEPEIADRNLIARNLKEEPMVIIGSPDADPDAPENIIFSEKGCSFRIAYENYLRQKNVKYLNPLEFSSIEAAKKCVMNGLGISFLPLYAVQSELESGSLKVLEAGANFERFITQLVYHKNKNVSLSMEKFIEIAVRKSAGWR
jgi:DNA-binding transcriptional LysR family regulator